MRVERCTEFGGDPIPTTAPSTAGSGALPARPVGDAELKP